MYATEKEIDEARELLVNNLDYGVNFSLIYECNRFNHDDGELKYFKTWTANCSIDGTFCKCCRSTITNKFYVSRDHKTPLEAANGLLKEIEAGNGI